MEYVIIIPAYNPDQRLPALIHQLSEMEAGLQFVVVDDGSDATSSEIFGAIAGQPNCRLCQHKTNQGKGEAIKTGIRAALQWNPSCIGFVTADADGQHSPEDVLQVAKALEENPSCLILGTRSFSEQNVPFKSRWGNRITSAVFFLGKGITLQGYPNGPARLAHAVCRAPLADTRFALRI